MEQNYNCAWCHEPTPLSANDLMSAVASPAVPVQLQSPTMQVSSGDMDADAGTICTYLLVWSSSRMLMC